MSKTIYLLILFIINSHAWNLRMINITSDNWLILQLAYLFVGFLYYGRMADFHIFSKELKYWWLWVLGIFLSMIPAYFNYEQSFSQSFITYRHCLLLIQIPILLKIAPTKKEVVNAILVYFGFVWIMYVLQQANPLIINVDEETLERLLRNNEPLMVHGWVFVIIVLFYYLDEIKEKVNLKLLLLIFLVFIFAFLEQNRSILFSITAIIGWTALKAEKNKIMVVLTIIIMAGAIAYFTADTWAALFEETTDQVENEEYNRNKAIQYFLYKASPNIWCYIFGNGFLSAHVTHHMQNMMDLGVYNNDVGFIGYWNNFGIIPIVVFMLMLIPVVLKKKYSHFLRCWALQITICGLTIWYWDGHKILFFALFYYFYYIDLEGQNSIELPETVGS